MGLMTKGDDRSGFKYEIKYYLKTQATASQKHH